MGVNLIVEDGNGVPGANSYDTVANVTQYAANRGIALPAEGFILTATPYSTITVGGYVVGDVLTAVQDDASAGELEVLAVDQYGNPTSYLVLQAGIGYTSATGVQTFGGTGYNAQVNLTVVGGAITAAVPYSTVDGFYVVNDILTVVQPNGGSGGQIKVLSVLAGIPQNYEVITPGQSYAAGIGLSTTGGSGHGAQVNITVSTGQVSTWLILGTDFLESFAAQFVGIPTNITQPLSWPRQLVMWNCDTQYPDNQIPPALIAALDQAVIVQSQGVTLMPTVDHSQGGYVTESKVDVLITKYSEKIGTTSAPLVPTIMALLNTLLIPVAALRTVRV